MKTTTIEKRLKESGINKTGIAFRVVKELIGGSKAKARWGNFTDRPYQSGYIDGTGLIRPCKVTGTGMFAHTSDYTYQILELLTKLKLKFEVGNDAPRGGKSGDFIKIITKIERI